MGRACESSAGDWFLLIGGIQDAHENKNEGGSLTAAHQRAGCEGADAAGVASDRDDHEQRGNEKYLRHLPGVAR